MRLIIYVLLVLGVVWLADWLWCQYWYMTARLAMARSDQPYFMYRGRCWSK